MLIRVAGKYVPHIYIIIIDNELIERVWYMISYVHVDIFIYIAIFLTLRNCRGASTKIYGLGYTGVALGVVLIKFSTIIYMSERQS